MKKADFIRRLVKKGILPSSPEEADGGQLHETGDIPRPGQIRQRLTFYGQVQGVGFRYTARNAAAELGITGWVENMWDGTVVVEAQGSAEEISRLIQMISEGRWIRIDRLTRETIPLAAGEKSFRVHSAY